MTPQHPHPDQENTMTVSKLRNGDKTLHARDVIIRVGAFTITGNSVSVNQKVGESVRKFSKIRIVQPSARPTANLESITWSMAM